MQLTSRTYNVAGHVFSLEMPMNHPIWAFLTNYEPFETEATEKCLYSLRVLEGNTPFFNKDTATSVLTDKSDEDMPRIELYEQDDKMLFRISMFRESPVCFEMLTEKDYSSADIVILSECGRFPVDNALMLLYAFRSAPSYTLEMHASVIKKDERAYLFLGRSGTGKSTHSRQWLSAFADAELLNDDNPIVRMVDIATNDSEDKPSLLPFHVYGSPWSGKTACYKNDSAPIAGIVLLAQAPENSIRKLTMVEAYAAIYSSSSGLRCNRSQADGLHATITKLLETIPCYMLNCLPNEDAANLCYQTCSH